MSCGSKRYLCVVQFCLILAVADLSGGACSASTTNQTGRPAELSFTGRYGSPDEYVVLGTAWSWAHAEAMCKKTKAKLLKLNDADDTKYVRELLRLYGFRHDYYQYFLGLTKERHAVKWSWRYDKCLLQYWKFEPGNLPPDVSKDNRCCSFGKYNGDWFPRGCHHNTRSPMYVICQRPKQEHYSCHDHPCRHGGTCISHNPISRHSTNENPPTNFTCQCRKGFVGLKCETEVRECSSNPCRNGYCLDDIGDFKCQCDEGFTGNTCEVDIDDCQFHRCHNNGTCQDGVASYTCLCPECYGGTLCERPKPLPTPELRPEFADESSMVTIYPRPQNLNSPNSATRFIYTGELTLAALVVSFKF